MDHCDLWRRCTASEKLTLQMEVHAPEMAVHIRSIEAVAEPL